MIPAHLHPGDPWPFRREGRAGPPLLRRGQRAPVGWARPARPLIRRGVDQRGSAWRAVVSGLQVLVGRLGSSGSAAKIADPGPVGPPRPRFRPDRGGSCRALGLFFRGASGCCSRGTYGFGRVAGGTSPSGNTVVIPKGSISPGVAVRGPSARPVPAVVLPCHVHAGERKGTRRVAVAAAAVPQQGLPTWGWGPQTIQWLIPGRGSFFVISVYLAGGLEVQRHQRTWPDTHPGHDRDPFVRLRRGPTGFARRHPQRWLIIAGFPWSPPSAMHLACWALVRARFRRLDLDTGAISCSAPGIGVMLTSSVNVVQFPAGPDK